MIRPAVSYRMEVNGPLEERKRFFEVLAARGYTPDYFELDAYASPALSLYGTPKDRGTTEQWMGLDDAMSSVIALFPALTVTIWESDEEPRANPRRLDFANGELTGVKYGTYFDPDEDWEGELLRELMDELGKHGYFDAIKVIKDEFMF